MYSVLTSAGFAVNYVGDQTVNPGGGLSHSERHHEGIGGINIADLQVYLVSKNVLTTYRPDIITLLIGFNSLYGAGGVSPEVAFSQLQSLCRYLVATLPNVRIIVATLPPSAGDLGASPATEAGRFNRSILSNGLVGLSSNISVVDLNASMTLADIGPDGLHPNQLGSIVMGRVFGEAIKEMFSNRSSPASLK